MVIEIVADLVCPWCYLGLVRLQRALAFRPARRPRILWRPFLLNPDVPPEGIPLPLYLSAASGGDPNRVIANLLSAAAPDDVLFDYARDASRAGNAHVTTGSLRLSEPAKRGALRSSRHRHSGKGSTSCLTRPNSRPIRIAEPSVARRCCAC